MPTGHIEVLVPHHNLTRRCYAYYTRPRNLWIPVPWRDCTDVVVVDLADMVVAIFDYYYCTDCTPGTDQVLPMATAR